MDKLNIYNIEYIKIGIIVFLSIVAIDILNSIRKRKKIKQFGELILKNEQLLNHSRIKHFIKNILFALGILLIFLAAGRLRWGTKLELVKVKGKDVIFCLDVSKSMDAKDIKPSRLASAKWSIKKIIDKLTTDRIGLIIFAGRAYIQVPWTIDYNAVKNSLDNVNSYSVPQPGTNIKEVIDKVKTIAENKLKTNKTAKTVVILITDGEDLETTSDWDKILETIKDYNINFFTIGVGTKNGEPVPDYDENNNFIGYKKDSKGNLVLSRLDETLLKKIALYTGGKYYYAGTGQWEIDKIIKEINKLEKKEYMQKRYTHYEEKYQYFLLIGFIFLLLEIFIKEKRR